MSTIEEARTLSRLSDRPHIFDDQTSSKKLVAFAGVVVPLSSFSMMFMWALAGSNFYHKIFIEQTELVDECHRLNPHLPSSKNIKIGPLITAKFKEVLSRLKPEEIEELVNHMFEESEVY